MGSALIRIFERPFYRKLHQPGEIGTTSACAENTQPSRTLPKTSGTTSAHAENTGAAASSTPNPRNYLRAHGEYLNELGLLWHDSQKWAKIRSGI